MTKLAWQVLQALANRPCVTWLTGLVALLKSPIWQVWQVDGTPEAAWFIAVPGPQDVVVWQFWQVVGKALAECFDAGVVFAVAYSAAWQL